MGSGQKASCPGWHFVQARQWNSLNLLVWNQWFSTGDRFFFCTPGDIWQWLERSFLVTTGHCHWKLVHRLGMHPNILQHTGIPSSLPNRQLFGLKCQQWWDSEIFNGFDGWMWGGRLGFSHSVQGLNPVRLFVTPWTAALQASLFITNSQRLSKRMSIELVMPSNHLILCCPLLLPSIFPSIRVFSNESTLLIRWPSNGVSASTSVFPMNTHDWSLLRWTSSISLQSKGTLKSLLQHHTSKGWILLHSAFFIVQLSHPYMTNGKIIALIKEPINESEKKRVKKLS